MPGVTIKQVTARDVVSRWDVLEAHTRATATLAAGFLDTLCARLPFPLRALQVDGGGEFAAQFEAAGQARGLQLFVLPPPSPNRALKKPTCHAEHERSSSPPTGDKELRSFASLTMTCPQAFFSTLPERDGAR